ncbi:hypothetical protein [Sulfitobacter sediminilitoris]|uniref:hypothetical protein n=1 Tax=Sulfitobacter sediminilitoris TaxID=2698830 RepID=UPI0019545D11|nr:hypothetical protein [Sulfitobacter sediminilitoris]
MQLQRKIAYAPRSRALAKDLSQLPGPCVGCEGCQGVCAALIDAMLLPEIVLRDRPA